MTDSVFDEMRLNQRKMSRGLIFHLFKNEFQAETFAKPLNLQIPKK